MRPSVGAHQRERFTPRDNTRNGGITNTILVDDFSTGGIVRHSLAVGAEF
jgi:hypothetical protein